VLCACAHAGSVSSTSPTRPAALAHCTTASFPQEPGSFPLDIPSPFLLALSLLKGPCSQRMSQALCLCKAEKKMILRIENAKAVVVCDVTKEGASTGSPCLAKGDGQGQPIYHLARNFFPSIEGVMQLNITPDCSLSRGTLALKDTQRQVRRHNPVGCIHDFADL
jgi:hypothetical protein